MTDLPEVITTYIAAYNAKDVSGMLACLGDDVTFQNFSGGDLTASADNKEAFAEMAQMGAAAFATRKQTVTAAITVQDTTLIRVDYEAVVAQDLPNGWTAGQELKFSGASSFRVKSGRIVSLIDES